MSFSSQTTNIVVLDGHAANPGDLSWEPFKAFGTLTIYPRTKVEEVIERAKDADIILTNKILFPRDVLVQLPRLRLIAILATGFNTVDCEAAKELGILVANIPAYSTESVAQLVFAHLLNVCNRVDHYATSTREGRWSKNPDFCYWDTPLIELQQKTFGIYGLGNIGKRVAQIANVLGMKVLATTRKRTEELPDYIEKVDFPTLLCESDVLSLHCPLNADTFQMMNETALSQMKSSAILINTGRGPLVDETAVANALSKGQLKAYCADVMTNEPPEADNPLLNQPNAFLTPHIAWATLEARQRLMQIAIENVRAFIEGRPQNIVNQ